MITWKEKVSLFGMKVSMAIVVGLATVVKPAMNTVLDYKERWKAGDDKEFFERLKNVFSYTDVPLPDTEVIELGIPNEDKIPASVIEALKSLGDLMKHAQANGLIDSKKQECVCCDCLEDCFCMDCPVHSAKMIDDTKTEIGGEAMHLEVPKQETVCCGCIGTDYCETCPVHGKTTHPVGICDVVGHDCSQVIEKRRISISGVPVGSKIEDLEVGDQVDIVDGAFANFKGRIVDILRPNNTIQLDVLIFGRTEKVMLPASQVRLIPKYKSDTFPGPSAAEERAVRLEKDMQVEIAKVDEGKKKVAKQANKKTKALDIANDMVARSHCSISGRAFSNQVAKIMEWPEDKINSEWQPIVAKQANKKKPSKKTKAKKTTKAKK